MGLHWRLHLSYALSDYYQAGLGLRNEGKYYLLFWLCIPSVVVSIVLSERFRSIGHCLKALLHCLPYRLFRNRPKIRRWNLRHSLRLSLIKSPNLSNRPKHWKVSPFATQNSAREILEIAFHRKNRPPLCVNSVSSSQGIFLLSTLSSPLNSKNERPTRQAVTFLT